MRIRVPKSYDRVMDYIANTVFPSTKPTRWRLGSHQVSQIDLTLAFYTLVIACALAWYYASWLYIPATILSMVFAGMVLFWFF